MTAHVCRRRREIARAAAVLAAGERLAHEVATRQGSIADRAAWARFFSAQARQERVHAGVFASAAELLAPGCDAGPLATDEIAALRARLDADLDAGRLGCSVVGLQVAIEALGAAVLDELGTVLANHLPALVPVHRMLARQEAAHQRFGVRWVEAAVAGGALRELELARAVRNYGPLTRDLLAACTGVLEGFDVAPARYLARFERVLPAWFLRAERA